MLTFNKKYHEEPMRQAMILVLWLAAFVFATSFTLNGQTQEIPTRITDQNRAGDLPFSGILGNEIEHVDLATGALKIRIPIANAKGRGLDYDYHLTYDSNFYVLASRVDQFGT